MSNKMPGYLGILVHGHCLSSSEWFRRSCIQGGPLYNRHSTHNFLLWIEWRCWLARLASCARRLVRVVDRRFESEARQEPKGKDWLLSNNGGSGRMCRAEDS